MEATLLKIYRETEYNMAEKYLRISISSLERNEKRGNLKPDKY